MPGQDSNVSGSANPDSATSLGSAIPKTRVAEVRISTPERQSQGHAEGSTGIGATLATPTMMGGVQGDGPPAWTSDFKKDILRGVREAVQEEMQPLRQDVELLRVKIGEVDTTAKAAIDIAKEAKVAVENIRKEGTRDGRLAEKVRVIEDQLANLKVSAAQGDGSTAAVGGMQDASSADAAIQWLKQGMVKASIDGFSEVYQKGDDTEKFNGMLYVKFISQEKRAAAIQAFNAAKVGMLGQKSFMSPELPLQQRIPKKILGDFKKILIAWGYKNIRFDESTMVLAVGGVDIVKATVEEYQFKPVWLQSSWGNWSDLTGDAKFQEIVLTAQNKLNQAQKHLDKGKGKGVTAA